jgi:hypothetical protein
MFDNRIYCSKHCHPSLRNENAPVRVELGFAELGICCYGEEDRKQIPSTATSAQRIFHVVVRRSKG